VSNVANTKTDKDKDDGSATGGYVRLGRQEKAIEWLVAGTVECATAVRLKNAEGIQAGPDLGEGNRARPGSPQ